MYDLRYYQAVATAIPTISIAFAVSGKYLAVDVSSVKNDILRVIYRVGVFLVGSLFIGAATRGEFYALRTLAQGHDSPMARTAADNAVILLGVFLAIAIVWPLARQFASEFIVLDPKFGKPMPRFSKWYAFAATPILAATALVVPWLV
jgi:hypothetical protein